MRKAYRIRIVLLLLAAAGLQAAVGAQESAFTATHQLMAPLPGDVKNTSVVDGDLYCYASEVLFKAQRSGGQLLGFWADTSVVRLNPEAQYVVRNPATGHLFFTAPNGKGRSQLFEVIPPQGKKKASLKKWKMGGMSVEHPTFTADGSIMIFASTDARRSLGGYDLWYSICERGSWGKPVNLGSRVNTSADEVSPFIYRDCLLFASNGHPGHPDLDIYSTRLISNKAVGDTVGMLQIGRCRVQRLPEPLNAAGADDSEMVIDTLSDQGYWVSSRSGGDLQLWSFSGALDGVMLWGRVTDKFEAVIGQAKVTALQDGKPVCSATTDDEGVYKLYLQAGQFYELEVRKEGCFTAVEAVNTAKADDEFLIGEARQDFTLNQLPYGQNIYFDDLFGPNADTELSERGVESLQPLVRFLSDNPFSSVVVTLYCDLTTDPQFNNLLTDQRLRSVEQLLYASLPQTVSIQLRNGCGGTQTCANASGRSRLVAVIGTL